MKSKLLLPMVLSIVSLALTLISVSYAWFSFEAKNTDVGQISGQIEGVNGVEFSVDAQTWHDTITSTMITSAGGLIPSQMVPISCSGIQNSDGILRFYDAGYTKTGNVQTMTSVDYDRYPTTYNGVIIGWSSGTGPYIVFDLYCHSENEQNLILASGTKVSSNKVQGPQLACRVAFLNLGTITQSEYSASYGYKTLQAQYGTDGAKAFVFEPNAQWHSQSAISLNYSSACGTIDPYYGIKAALTKIPANPLTTAIKTSIANGENYSFNYDGQNFTVNSASGLELINSISYAGAQVSQDTNYIYTDTLLVNDTENIVATIDGYSKIRVYIWLEGQDGDCIKEISNASLSFFLKFTTVELTELS